MWELDHKESWGLKKWCFWTVVLEKTLESPLVCKENQPVNPKGNHVLNIHWKDWCWSWNSNTLATWYEELTHWKRPWCWERLKAAREGDDRRWDGWMASLTQWTWVWASSRSWWWTGKPGVLQSMGLQRVGPDSATELNWTDVNGEITWESMLVCVKAMTRVFWIISKIVHCRKSKNIINFYIGYCSEKEKPEFQHMCLKIYFFLSSRFYYYPKRKVFHQWTGEGC